MIVFLRFIGVTNAAIWFGGAVFCALAIDSPVFFTPELTRLFGEVYTRVIQQAVVERYYVLFYWCGVIAFIHQLAEWVYLGRALQRLTLGILGTVFCLGLIGGLWLHPKLQKLHEVRHAKVGFYPPAMQAQAARSFGIWYSVSQVAKFFSLAGLLCYTWRVTNPPPGPRFSSATKFRS